MAPFKDEHILIITPGSQTTLAQLGLPESFTPAQHRFATRMFPGMTKNEWEPFKPREKTITVKRRITRSLPPAPSPEDGEQRSGEEQKNPSDAAKSNEQDETKDETGKTTNGKGEQKEQKPQTTEAGDGDADIEMNDAGAEATTAREETIEIEEAKTVYEEDPTNDEGAVYPIRDGAITNWSCFFALLEHIYNVLNPPFHTPILIVAQPAWTARDREFVTQFAFEKFKTPAFALIDSALAVTYAYGVPTATVVDVGYTKADVTAVTDFAVNDLGRGIALRDCGGETMTACLLELLRARGFSRAMCEQLKCSSICEILPPGSLRAPQDAVIQRAEAAPQEGETRNPGTTTVASGAAGGDEPRNEEQQEEGEKEGVLNVAEIVAGDPNAFLASREREKAEEEAAARAKADGDAADLSNTARLPNAQRERAPFVYQDYVKVKDGDGSDGEHYAPRDRSIEVGPERFRALTHLESHPEAGWKFDMLDTLAAQIYHTIMSISDASKRAEQWDSFIIVGNGSKVKGFSQALLSVLSQKYLLSPSAASIFTHDIQSAVSTPRSTSGANTPIGQRPPNPQFPSQQYPHPLVQAPSQTPLSLKILKPPEHFPEWKRGQQTHNQQQQQPQPQQQQQQAPNGHKPAAHPTPPQAGSRAANARTAHDNAATTTTTGSREVVVGFEEAVFLGAQVAAKVVFFIDQGLHKGCLYRNEYNEMGPAAIHDLSL